MSKVLEFMSTMKEENDNIEEIAEEDLVKEEPLPPRESHVEEKYEELFEAQNKKITLNVEGTLFEVSSTVFTDCKFDNIFTQLLEKNGEKKEIFLDESSTLFPHILDFLRRFKKDSVYTVNKKLKYDLPKYYQYDTLFALIGKVFSDAETVIQHIDFINYVDPIKKKRNNTGLNANNRRANNANDYNYNNAAARNYNYNY